MAPLPKPLSHTMLAMHRAKIAARSSFDSIGIGAGIAATECAASLWFSFRWASHDVVDNPFRVAIMDAGIDMETRMLNDLERVVDTLQRVDPDTCKQRRFFLLGGHVRGKMDGRAWGVPEAPTAPHVVECKTGDEKGLKALQKDKMAKAKPMHMGQVTLYMMAEGWDRAFYHFRSRESQQDYVERVELDPVYGMRLVARLETTIRATSRPGRIGESPDKFPCGFCHHRQVCHHKAFARVNCRTCIHSTPVIEEGSEAARWVCEKTGWDLSVDQQRAACRQHRYLPSMVPGEQVDVRGEKEISVVYTVNGSPWTDGPKVDIEPATSTVVDDAT